MAQIESKLKISADTNDKPKNRSALGVGVTTLVTIMTVLLMVAFAVLSLVSARSNLSLSEMAVTQAQIYYTVDSEATEWYAELDAFAAGLEGVPSSFARQLTEAGYEVQDSGSKELRVTRGFMISEHRSLMVTVQINNDKTTTIRQWQS